MSYTSNILASNVPVKLLKPWFQTAKRIFDYIFALIGLVVLSPFLVAIAVYIKLDSPGPVIFSQWRVGLGGRYFKILKFRTMVFNASPLLSDYLNNNPAQNMYWEHYQKLKEDPRLTRAGRILRRFSLDELPQLWNVLRGDMSLVGPRPFFPEQCEEYGRTYAAYIRFRPGITGLWQISGRNLVTFEERVRWDEQYYQSWSFRLDLGILWQTVSVILRGEGAY